MMEEVWKDVKGYEDYYLISSLGRLYVKPRISAQGSNRSGKLSKCKPKFRDGKPTYKTVSLTVNNVRYYKLLHRLVAETFIPNPYCKPHVNHIDGDKHNNSVENLEWVSQDENMQHAEKNHFIPTHGREYPIKVIELSTGEEYYFINTRVASKYFNKSKTYFGNIPSVENLKGRYLDNDYIIEKVGLDLNEYYII